MLQIKIHGLHSPLTYPNFEISAKNLHVRGFAMNTQQFAGQRSLINDGSQLGLRWFLPYSSPLEAVAASCAATPPFLLFGALLAGKCNLA